MEGRGSMASYYMQRGMGGSGLIHSPPGFRPMSNPGLPVQSNYGASSAGSTFPVESPSSGAANVTVSAGMPTSGEPMKRKRGRPRKYGPDGTISTMSPTANSAPPASSAPASSLASPVQKRGRGRPPGSGSKQQLAALGQWVSGSAGMGFTPHVITIPVGEDVASKIMSFSQQGPRAVCILSANGSVSTATLRQPASSGGIVTYEGRFEILSLSGSYLLSDDNGSNSRTGGLSISLSSPDGRVIGGGVGGMLIASSPVQVIAGSFIYSRTKMKSKSGMDPESCVEYDRPNGDGKFVTPTSVPPGQSLSPTMGGWPSLRSADMRNTHTDLDLTHG
ncbi:hypothetical protein AAC387_Pa11g0314 [Persea americana]|eukprot:TRINITY_DN298_c0_g1_i3.p1 TRINITY_DN298_c0_g1~~TRINITY_DN298_c0_g1_i3.p1  ORF type:complete len:334 (-),score=63.15 TRINITY_DN298_c0_g1_i3:762-1763(-)